MADKNGRRLSAASRPSLRRSHSSQSNSSDVFSDSHAIDQSTATDGFGPFDGEAPPRSRPRTPPRMSTRRSMSSRTNDDAQQQPQHQEMGEVLKRRSLFYQSGNQTAGSRNSFSLRNDAPATLLQRSASSASRPEMSHRPVSMASTFSLPRSQSPFLGASGPSHPYGMYPQDATSLNRSSTTSTVRPPAERPYTGSNQPTHPYAMYSQDITPEMAPDPLAASRDITTIGFPGLSQGLSRRLAPGSDDADDLVGADGYTEQLPPYTRYPDRNEGKGTYVAGPAASLNSTTTTAVEGASGSRSTEALAGANAASNVDEHSDGVSEDESENEESPANGESSRRAIAKAKWAKKSKRRLWKGRIPAWVLCLGMFLLVVIAATIGGVIGRFMQHPSGGNTNNKPLPSNDSYPDPESWPSTVVFATTTIVDAVSLTSTPTNLPTLPLGNFGFELGYPLEQANECLTEVSQGVAWGCADDGWMLWDVTPADIGSTKISLSYSKSDWETCYGPQPPEMPKAVPLSLMEDLEQENLGPAYFFQTTYTKTVILQSDALDTSGNSKRSLSERFYNAIRSPKLQRRDTPVNPGDTPWVCYWNNTILEGFIYLLQTELPVSLAPAAPTTGGGDPAATATGTADGAAYPTGGYVRRRDQRITNFLNDGDGNGGGDGDGDDDDDDGGYATSSLPSYPMALKVEERRLPNNPVRPYCMQMWASKEVILFPNSDSNGNTPIIQLDETDPDTQQRVVLGSTYKSAGISKRRSQLQKRQQPVCICQWMIS